MAMVSEIDVVALFELLSEGAALHVIDVREPNEFKEGAASCAKSHPLSRLVAGDTGDLLAAATRGPTYLICRSGARSTRACELLRAAGAAQPINVRGGMLAWQAAGLPVVRT
jgi:rhodanese-related sulfurtransferase